MTKPIKDNSIQPNVSVVMITYMHEAFITDAIEGVLMQEVDFPIELIIADDSSQDNTENIVKKITNEHPNGNWIKYIKHKTNAGMIPNFIWALKQAQGKYIALCEGDDNWIDPYKLKKQVDSLESNPNVAICFTNGIKMNDSGEIIGDIIPDNYHPGVFDTKYLLSRDCMIPTASILFRNTKIELDLKLFPMGDYPLIYFLSKKGKIAYIKEKMMAYRIHDTSYIRSHSTIELKKKQIICIEELINYDKTYKSTLKYIKSIHLDVITAYYLRERKIFPATIFFTKSIFNFPFRSISNWRDTIYRIRKYGK